MNKKTSKKSLCWNVYVEDINSKSIVPFNIFNHSGFLKFVENDFKKYSTDCVAFGEQLKHDLQYYLQSRAEYEIILYDLHETGIKLTVSAYDQVLLNWDVFVSYVFDSLS